MIKQNGLPVVETLLTARSIMYPTVYFHPFTRGAELMLARCANHAIESGKMNVSDFTKFTDHKLMSTLERLGGKFEQIVKDFENRKIIKPALSITNKLKFQVLRNLIGKRTTEMSIADKLGVSQTEICRFTQVFSFARFEDTNFKGRRGS